MTDSNSTTPPVVTHISPYAGSSTATWQSGRALTAHTRRDSAHPKYPHMLTGTPFVGTPAPKHPRVVAWQKKHPFKPVPMKPKRWTLLQNEAFLIYKAIAFAMRHHGVVLNAHLTFGWSYLGVSDGEQAAWILTRFNQEATKWLKVGHIPAVAGKRRSKRNKVESSEHMYVYVHEWGERHGLHTHELAFLPPAKRKAFEAWARSCLQRLCKQDYLPAQAFRMTGPEFAVEHKRVWLCWKWFRYITKTMDPNWQIRVSNGKFMIARGLFNPRWFPHGGFVNCAQLASGSHNIWTQAQARAGFVARLYKPDHGDIYDGLELDELRWELAEAAEEAKRAAFRDVLQTLNL